MGDLYGKKKREGNVWGRAKQPFYYGGVIVRQQRAFRTCFCWEAWDSAVDWGGKDEGWHCGKGKGKGVTLVLLGLAALGWASSGC